MTDWFCLPTTIRSTLVPLTLVALWVPLLGQQADRGRTEALSRRAADRMQALQQEADRLATEERTLLGELRKLEVERQLKREQASLATAKATAASNELATTTAQIARLEGEEVAERPELRARLVELYKLGQGRYLRLLLSVSDVRSVGQASRMVAALAVRDNQRIASHQKRLNDLQTARKSLETRAKEFEALRIDADRARLAADRAVAARNALIKNVDSQRDLNAQFTSELQAAQQKLQQTLRGLATGAATSEPALPLAPFRGDLDWPVAGTVRQPFSRTSPGRPASNGVEIGSTEGDSVRAIHGGTIAFADIYTSYGKLVIVDHGGQNFSLYGNLLDIAVARGARVEHGDILGTVGPAITGSGAALYFELNIDGRPVDPLQWLKRK